MSDDHETEPATERDADEGPTDVEDPETGDAPGEGDPEVDVGESTPGPKGEGAGEAEQVGGEPATRVVDDEDDEESSEE